jgi:hypothetical protein
MTEILKQYVNNEYPDNYVTKEEWDKIKSLVGDEYRYYDDKANDYFAIALLVDFDTADTLVDELNEINECWFVGDPDEEYVFVN